MALFDIFRSRKRIRELEARVKRLEARAFDQGLIRTITESQDRRRLEVLEKKVAALPHISMQLYPHNVAVANQYPSPNARDPWIR